MKDRAEMKARKLKPNIVLEKPWQNISVDFNMKLLVLRDHNLILVVCNRFLKMLHFIAMIEKITAEGLVSVTINTSRLQHGGGLRV